MVSCGKQNVKGVTYTHLLLVVAEHRSVWWTAWSGQRRAKEHHKERNSYSVTWLGAQRLQQQAVLTGRKRCPGEESHHLQMRRAPRRGQ